MFLAEPYYQKVHIDVGVILILGNQVKWASNLPIESWFGKDVSFTFSLHLEQQILNHISWGPGAPIEGPGERPATGGPPLPPPPWGPGGKGCKGGGIDWMGM